MTLSRKHRAELKRSRPTLSPTAKSEHRAQALDLARGDDGMVRCILRGELGHECGGRLQAHHAIPVQTLRNLHAQARGQSMYPGRPPGPEHLRRLGRTTLDDLVSDGRNAQIVCELGHRQIELGRFAPAPSPQLLAFAEQYRLQHLIEPPSGEEEEVA